MNQSISLDQLALVEGPISAASGMPNVAYTDAEFHRFERDHLFAPTWAALAYEGDYAEAGVVTPVDFMGLPLLIVRPKDGELAVFHNVCSHRGMRLVRTQKKTNGLLVCPYHSWSYDLSGALQGTPNIGGSGEHQVAGFCRDAHGLRAVRSHCWMGVLFINLDGKAPGFDTYAAPLMARYAQYVGAHTASGETALVSPEEDDRFSLDINCNWKLAVENYCEAYHLPTIHPELDAYSPLSRHYNMLISDDFAGQGTDTFVPVLAGDASLPTFADWPADQQEIAEYPTFYPNLLLGFQANHFYAAIIHPLAAARCREEFKVFYVGDGAAGAQYAPCRRSNIQAWERIFREDTDALEGLQLGRGSPGFGGGVFSPKMDVPTHHFHRWVARGYRRAYVAGNA